MKRLLLFNLMFDVAAVSSWLLSGAVLMQSPQNVSSDWDLKSKHITWLKQAWVEIKLYTSKTLKKYKCTKEPLNYNNVSKCDSLLQFVTGPRF